MNSITIKALAKPNFRSQPIMVEGLPGFGQVGRVAVEHMIDELKAKKFAELYSTSFPPEVFVDRMGLVHAIKNDFYYVPGKPSLILVIGDTQASDIRGQHELAEAIVDVAKKHKAKLIITLGGYAIGALKEKPKVYGATTNPKLISEYEKHGVEFKSKKERGGIVGASGLLLSIGKMKGIDGICLMGETPGHPLFVDAQAAEAVLIRLNKILGIKMSLKKLDKRVEEIEKFRTTIQQLMEKAIETKETPTTGEELRYIG